MEPDSTASMTLFVVIFHVLFLISVTTNFLKTFRVMYVHKKIREESND